MRFFETPADWRAWLEQHSATEPELLVGFWKTGSGRPSMTWPESVEQALCFGWIDAVRRRVDDESYTIRFTPRRPGSTWSAVNVRLFGELEAKGLMTDAGRAAFAQRREDRTATYSYEQADEPVFAPEEVALLTGTARDFWEAQPPGYRRTATHWVVSAKRPETRRSRMATLVADCGAGLRIKHLRRP